MILTDNSSVTDRQLMYAWLYGDIVHADDVDKRHKVDGLSFNERYWAAAGMVARIAAWTEDTLKLSGGLLTAATSR